MILSEKETQGFLLVYCFLALVLSAWLLRFSYFIGDDGAYYARVGQNLIAGKGISANPGEPYLIHPPFYPFLVGLCNLFFRDLEFAGHFVSMLAFSLTLIPLFLLTRDIYSKEAAHWACLLYFTNGFLLIHSNLVMTEPLFTFLTMTLLYGIHRIVQEKSRRISIGIPIGFIAGTAFLTRPEGLLFFVAGILSLFLLDQRPLRFKLRVALLSTIVFLIFFLPYFHFVYQKSHKLQLSQGITEIFIKRQMDVAEGGTRREAEKIYEGLTNDKSRLKMEELVKGFRLIDYLTKDHFALARSALSSVIWRWLSLNQYLFGGLGFFLIGASWLSHPWDSKRKKSEFLFLLFLSTFSCKLFAQFLPQYYFHYFPVFLIWMGNGVEVLRNWARATLHLSLRGSWAWGLSCWLLLAVSSGWYLHRILTNFPPPFEYKELGIWIKKNIGGIEEEGIASRQPAVSFYSGARILKLPYTDQLEDLLVYLRCHRAKYFVVADNLEQHLLKAYRSLLDETQPPPRGISRVHTIKARNKVVLYQRDDTIYKVNSRVVSTTRA